LKTKKKKRRATEISQRPPRTERLSVRRVDSKNREWASKRGGCREKQVRKKKLDERRKNTRLQEDHANIRKKTPKTMVHRENPIAGKVREQEEKALRKTES